jgi:hypothetical protein
LNELHALTHLELHVGKFCFFDGLLVVCHLGV